MITFACIILALGVLGLFSYIFVSYIIWLGKGDDGEG